MRALVVYAHPSPTSFCAALFRETCDALRSAGAEVDPCDLYEEGFDPVLSREAFGRYLRDPENRTGVETHVDRLLAAEHLVFVYPVWHDGPPAILKGYFDRVFLRGVVFEIDPAGVFFPRLNSVRRLSAIALYGADRVRTRRVGDLPRRFFKHNLATLVPAGAELNYLAAYGMDKPDAGQRARFIGQVRRLFRKQPSKNRDPGPAPIPA